MKRLILCAAFVVGCGGVKVDPVKIQPIHITVDVNLHDAEKTSAAEKHESATGDSR